MTGEVKDYIKVKEAYVVVSGVPNQEGQLKSTGIDNASTIYGHTVRAGSVLIGDSSSGVITFASSFTGSGWYMTLTPRNWTIPVASTTGSVANFSISGNRHASGGWAYGPSGTVADWIAVGT